MITALTDPNQLPNQLQDQQTFDTNMASMIDNLPLRAQQENALAANMSAFAAGGAYAFMFGFDSATADADPGVGRLRLGSTQQNTATVMRIDQQMVGGTSIAALLDAIGAGTSVLKGAIRMVKVADPASWMLFDVLAVNAATGYRNLTVVHRASSAASPFSNNDSLMIYLDRAGDVGNGAEVLLPNGVADITAATPLINFLNIFSSLYDNYRIEITGLTASTPGAIMTRVANAGAVASTSSYSSPQNGGGSTTVLSDKWFTPNVTAQPDGALTVTIEILNVNAAATPVVMRASGAYRNTGTPAYISIFEEGLYIAQHVVSGFQLSRASGNFTGGKIRVYGRRN